MPILIKPYLGCNLKCKYCYQSELKNRTEYDLDEVLKTVDTLYDKAKYSITLHGGEPLCMGHDDVEKVLKHCIELSKKSSIQTNGSLIDKRYIEMFKTYNTNIGVSLDGENDLNDLRCDLETTQKIYNNIVLLHENKIPTYVIITVHNHNAGTDDQLMRLKEFILKLDAIDIAGRLNPNHSKYALNTERMKVVYTELSRFMLENKLAMKWSIFSDIINSLRNVDNVVCSLRDCDIYNTNSAEVVLGNGMRSNCLRTEIMLRHPERLNTRTEILADLEQDLGGCKGCKFFEFCKGGCPSNARDWRVKDSYCAMYYTVFNYFSIVLGTFGLTSQCTPQPFDVKIRPNSKR